VTTLNTHNRKTSVPLPLGIRTHNLSRRAAADLRLKTRSHWDRKVICSMYIIQIQVYFTERQCASIRRSIGEWCVGKREMLIVRDHTEHTLCAKCSTLVLNLAGRRVTFGLERFRNSLLLLQSALQPWLGFGLLNSR
jgi:hypothetical protein